MRQGGMERIAEIITEEMARFSGERYAEQLRWAAWLVREELGDGITSTQFGNAAASLGLHRQGAMNRWNEAMKNWELMYS